MGHQPVAADFDALCAIHTGPEIVELVRKRLPDHDKDPVQSLFYRTYAKRRDCKPHLLKDEDRARVMRDYLFYSAREEATDLPLYFVRPLLPGYLEPA